MDEKKNDMPIPQPSRAEEFKESVVPAPVRRSGIEVVATRNGVWKCARKVEGDRFMVSDMSKVGSWMRCADPKVEEQRQKMMKQVKVGLK